MRMTRLPILLVVFAACAGQAERGEREVREEREELLKSSLGVAAVEPVLVRRLGGDISHFRSDTLVWTDTATRGDTTFVSRGRAVTTTAVLTDSQWVQLTPPPRRNGIPFGLFSTWDGTQLQPNAELLTMT